jgi:predicted MFS family arabinose efflux permease
MRSSWRVLAGHRDLRLVLGAGLISRSGDWILLVGLLYRVYAMTGSTIASALTMMSAVVPQVALGQVAGVFADRWDRKRTMVVADLLMAIGLLPLLVVRSAGQVWIVFIVLLWEGAVQQFFSPAEQAIVPRLVPDEQLLVANALNGQVSDLSRLAGSALGGIVAAIGGVVAVAVADAGSFVASAVLLLVVKTSGETAKQRDGARRIAAVLTDLRDGFRLMAGPGALRALMIFALVTGIGEGVFGSLLAPFVEQVLKGNGQDFGWIAAAQAVGGIAGGLLAAAVSQRLSAAKLLGYGAVALGVVDLAIFLYPIGYVAVWPAIAGMILAGLPSALSVAGMVTLLQRASDDAYRGRVFGTLGAVQGVAVLAGTLTAGLLSRDLGIIGVITIQGAAWVLAGLGMMIWLRKGTASDPDVGDRTPRRIGVASG